MLRWFLHRHEGWPGHLLLAPALIVMAMAILFPLGMTLAMRTWSLSGHDINTTPGISNYAAMAENPMFRILILRTLTVAATCTLIIVILVYPMAYFVAFHTYGNKALSLIVLALPFWTSVKVACLVSVLCTAIAIPAALAIARYRMPGKAPAIGFIMLPLLLPGQILAFSFALIFASLRLAKMGQPVAREARP